MYRWGLLYHSRWALSPSNWTCPVQHHSEMCKSYFGPQHKQSTAITWWRNLSTQKSWRKTVTKIIKWPEYFHANVLVFAPYDPSYFTCDENKMVWFQPPRVLWPKKLFKYFEGCRRSENASWGKKTLAGDVKIEEVFLVSVMFKERHNMLIPHCKSYLKWIFALLQIKCCLSPCLLSPRIHPWRLCLYLCWKGQRLELRGGIGFAPIG